MASGRARGDLPASVRHTFPLVEWQRKFDLDEDLRLELLADAERVAKELGPPAGVLVTGDIAFAGAGEDYLRAKQWLSELCDRFGRTIEIVWSVPGNHDVDRGCVKKSPLLQDQHHKLRSIPEDDIDRQLTDYLRDPEAGGILFRPIAEYNRFAGAFGCSIHGDSPYGKIPCVVMSTYVDACIVAERELKNPRKIGHPTKEAGMQGTGGAGRSEMGD